MGLLPFRPCSLGPSVCCATAFLFWQRYGRPCSIEAMGLFLFLQANFLMILSLLSICNNLNQLISWLLVSDARKFCEPAIDSHTHPNVFKFIGVFALPSSSTLFLRWWRFRFSTPFPLQIQRFILCTWFGEFWSCCSLTALPGPAWVLLNWICKELISSLYT